MHPVVSRGQVTCVLDAKTGTSQHPILTEVSRNSANELRVYIHVNKRDDGTIPVVIATCLKEVLGGLAGVQYDDGLAKNTRREHVPYRTFG